ncbi:MAG: molybdate ABC transporter substrate-binding protein [Rhodothalassiaceae bacterium]
MRGSIPFLAVGLALALALLQAGPSLAASGHDQERPLVAAASNMRYALAELTRQFSQETGIEPRLSFGASGAIAQQILRGAPYELFLAADAAHLAQLRESGHMTGEGRFYAMGRLVLIARLDSPLWANATDGDALGSLAAATNEGRIARFAIANPQTAPYGAAAAEVLRAAGLYERLKGKLVIGETVAQATHYALAPDVDGGLVALSLALIPEIAGRSRHIVLPERLHAPLCQPMALLAGAGEGARRFHDWLQSDTARTVLQRFGYAAADERCN